MEHLNFSSLLKIMVRYSKKKQMTFMVRELLGEPIKSVGIRNEKRSYYKVTPKMASDFFNGEEDIYPNLRRGLNTFINGHDSDGTKLMLYFNRISANSMQNPYIFKELYELSQADSDISRDKKNTIATYYKASNWKLFFRQIFLCAVNANNKTVAPKEKKVKSLADEDLTVADIIDILKTRKKVIIVTPDDVRDSELKYVEELLKVYSEETHVEFKTKSDLLSHPELSKDFNKQRDYFYAAESIRVGLRDTEVYGRHFFDDLKDEVYTGLEDTCERKYSSGKDKMNTVMDRVTLIPLNSLLTHIPDWIKAQERKGVCHMLVNEDKIHWVEEKDE